jgi:hypothetical protein
VGHGFVDVTGADAGQLQRVQASADALVGHLKSHWTALGQDRPWWQELGRVRFWPCTLGVPGRLGWGTGPICEEEQAVLFLA